MAQRGFRPRDLELIRSFGSPVQEGYLVTRADIEALATDLQRLERMLGALLVEREGSAITIYRPAKQRRRRVQKNESRRRGNKHRRQSTRTEH
jgi:hypothetical protein